MVPAASITLATHAFGNAILLYYMFSPLLEHDSIIMVSTYDLLSCIHVVLPSQSLLIANNLINTSYIISRL